MIFEPMKCNKGMILKLIYDESVFIFESINTFIVFFL